MKCPRCKTEIETSLASKCPNCGLPFTNDIYGEEQNLLSSDGKTPYGKRNPHDVPEIGWVIASLLVPPIGFLYVLFGKVEGRYARNVYLICSMIGIVAYAAIYGLFMTI